MIEDIIKFTEDNTDTKDKHNQGLLSWLKIFLIMFIFIINIVFSKFNNIFNNNLKNTYIKYYIFSIKLKKKT
jgi:hypothetical protein